MIAGWTVRQRYFLGIGIVCLLAAVAIGYQLHEAAPSTAATSEEEALCRRFMDLKNAGDSRADELLTPAPVAPKTPVTEDEGRRLDAQFIARNRFQVLEVRRHPGSTKLNSAGPRRFVLILKGGCASEPLTIKTATGVEESQRFLLDPDLIVEVRDGKIHPFEVRAHSDS